MNTLFDWLFTDTSKTQTPAEAQANYSSLQSQLAAQDASRLAAGTITPDVYNQNQALVNAGPLQDPGRAATGAFFAGLNPFSSASPSGTGAGIGTVIKDVFILGAIGAALWVFFKFGGAGLLKTHAKKSKWFAAGIVGAVALLGYFIYSQFQKTATDTQQTVSGIGQSFTSLI